MSANAWKTRKGLARSSAIMLLALPILGACSPTRSECVVFQAIRADERDTRSTQNQVATHNRKGMSLCGWKP